MLTPVTAATNTVAAPSVPRLRAKSGRFQSAVVSIQAGHSTGTVAPEGQAAHGQQGRQRESASRAPGWPRLMSLELAGTYLGVSEWVVREWINDGTVPVVLAKRPHTASALKHRPQSDALRRVLVDRADLDALADSFPRERR